MQPSSTNGSPSSPTQPSSPQPPLPDSSKRLLPWLIAVAFFMESLDRCGHGGKHVWLKDWENEVSKLRHAWTDEDEAHEKAGQRDPPEQAERRQRVQHGSDEDEDHEVGVHAPANVEETAHGRRKASQILLD